MAKDTRTPQIPAYTPPASKMYPVLTLTSNAVHMHPQSTHNEFTVFEEFLQQVYV